MSSIVISSLTRSCAISTNFMAGSDALGRVKVIEKNVVWVFLLPEIFTCRSLALRAASSTLTDFFLVDVAPAGSVAT